MLDNGLNKVVEKKLVVTFKYEKVFFFNKIYK